LINAGLYVYIVLNFRPTTLSGLGKCFLYKNVCCCSFTY